VSASTDLLAVLAVLGSRLPPPFGFDLSEDGAGPGPDHPLAYEITAALAGRPASLPHIGPQFVTWVTLGPSSQALREAVADLRCWILPSFGWEASPPLVTPGEGSGELSEKLLKVSPAGYFRWECRRNDLNMVIEKLRTMRRLGERAPPRSGRLRPTLGMLRRQFTVALATGHYALATEALDEVDRRQLDTAVNSLSMRIRRDEAFGDHRAIVDNPHLDHLLTFTLPRRVSAAIVRAHHTVVLADIEEVADFARAATIYREKLYDRLSGLLSLEDAGTDPALIRMVAYNAWADGDTATLSKIGTDDPLAAHVHSDLTNNSSAEESSIRETVPTEHSPPTGTLSTTEVDAAVQTPRRRRDPTWADVCDTVISHDHTALDAFLKKINAGPEDFSRGIGDGAALLELFIDDRVVRDPEASERADIVLTAVIDAYVCEPAFPQKARLPLYDNILEIWSDTRFASNDPSDGQLMLTLCEAILRLDGNREASVAERIRRWWKARPARARLAWLAEALELLTDHSVSEEYLALWYDAAAILNADGSLLGPNDRRLWVRLGRRLGLDTATAHSVLGIVVSTVAIEADPLGASSFKKVAIVSLHEKAAKEAAQEIERRTGASVIIVSDYAAGDATQSAATADVILFVWGAAKHAVYRAFDKVRDRLEYVQGTGSGSIVRALERRVTRATLA